MGEIHIKPTIAIDGPAGAGKSTVARELAKKLEIDYLDTGAMYRAVTYAAWMQNIDMHDEEALKSLVTELDLAVKTAPSGETKTYINGKDVTPFIRSPEINRNVSFVAASPSVRRELVKLQKRLGEKGGIVMDGRDIGVRVLPDAPFKFFLTASLSERAKRRFLEMENQNPDLSRGKVEEEIARRDEIDSGRKVDPLKVAPGSMVIDTTALNIHEVVDVLIKKIHTG